MAAMSSAEVHGGGNGGGSFSRDIIYHRDGSGIAYEDG